MLNMVTTYSRRFLSGIGANLSDLKLNGNLWRSICSLGISRVKPTRRGCRAARKQQLSLTSHQNGELHFDSSSSLTNGIASFAVSGVFENLKPANLHSSTLNIPANTPANNNIPVIVSLNRLDTQRICKVANQQNNITIKRLQMPPKPSFTKPTVFRLLNARSIRNKTLSIKDLVVGQDIDCLAITET